MATKAEEFRAAEQKTGSRGRKPKRTSRKKPKKSAWKHESHHAQAKATHAYEPRPSHGKRPSRVSSRASANRAKGDAPFEHRREDREASPDSRYREARGRSSHVRGR